MNELAQYFRFKCEKGLKAKGLSDKQEYIDRLNFEIEVINNMGFPGYFLIVSDIINWSKRNDIYCGPGRGSAAGSLVSYCLGITALDPIKWDLLFERFLNPDRMGTPDYQGTLGPIEDTTDLTTDKLLDILESRGLEDARLQDIKRMS